MADIREKIKKLLALGGSPNENEARDALLKARALMAKHKLSEDDFRDEKSTELVHIACEEAQWTSDSGNIWMTELCKLLCDNYCCVAAWSHQKGHRTYTLQITGIREDADLCKSVVQYAVGFIKSATKVACRRYRGDQRSITVSYARGFVEGLRMAFEDQQEEHKEWGLVMVKPEEVKNYEEGLGNKSVKTKQTNIDARAYLRGRKDGHEFNANKVIGQA